MESGRQDHSLPGKCALILLVFCGVGLAADPASWPQFRGPTGQGLAFGTSLPTTWNESKNVIWKTTLPGRGHSSPVIWGNQIWVTVDSGDGAKLGAVCVDRNTGDIIHQVVVFPSVRVLEIHADNNYASPTPVIEEGRLFVHYGRYGTACVDTDTGEVLWRNNGLVIEHQGGPGSSPVLFEDLLIVNCDGADEQYVVALDKYSGAIRWKQPRTAPFRDNPIFKRAFSTPLLIHEGNRPVLVSVGADQTHAYDPTTGDELWHVRYTGFSNVPAPVSANGMVYLVTGFFGPQVMAVRLGGAGDISTSHVAWRSRGAIPETPSPLLIDGRLFLISNSGVGSALDVETEERVWLKRLGGKFSASPITDGQHVYFCSREGETHVVSLDEEPQVIATNRLDRGIWASPAVAGDSLFLRTEEALYRIEQPDRTNRAESTLEAIR